jgi:hypothetical protein
MVTQSIQRLEELCHIIPPLLQNISPEEFRQKPSPNKWSKQEELGHLIDSATNNHQRFIRVQFEDMPTIIYIQDQWVRLNHYNELPMADVMELWRRYNLHLAEVAKRIPVESLSRLCHTGGEPVTLEFLIDDYVVHQEHHLRHIAEY